jgi:hypothetical protein
MKRYTRFEAFGQGLSNSTGHCVYLYNPCYISIYQQLGVTMEFDLFQAIYRRSIATRDGSLTVTYIGILLYRSTGPAAKSGSIRDDPGLAGR